MDLGFYSIVEKLTVESPLQLEMDRDTSPPEQRGVGMSSGMRVTVDKKDDGT